MMHLSKRVNNGFKAILWTECFLKNNRHQVDTFFVWRLSNHNPKRGLWSCAVLCFTISLVGVLRVKCKWVTVSFLIFNDLWEGEAPAELQVWKSTFDQGKTLSCTNDKRWTNQQEIEVHFDLCSAYTTMFFGCSTTTPTLPVRQEPHPPKTSIMFPKAQLQRTWAREGVDKQQRLLTW